MLLFSQMIAVGKYCPVSPWNESSWIIPWKHQLAEKYAWVLGQPHQKIAIYSRRLLTLGIGFTRQTLKTQACSWCFLCGCTLIASSLASYGSRTDFSGIWRQFKWYLSGTWTTELFWSLNEWMNIFKRLDVIQWRFALAMKRKLLKMSYHSNNSKERW